MLGCSGPSLCGRDLSRNINAAGVSLLHMAGGQTSTGQSRQTPKWTTNSDLQAILTEYTNLFEPALGSLKGRPVKLQLRPDATPRFLKTRPVPYALRTKVSRELNRLQAEGVPSPVTHAKWATPIVPVVNKNATVRLCGDFKLTLNAACHTEQYPLPIIEDIFASLRGGEVFSTLDLSNACNA